MSHFNTYTNDLTTTPEQSDIPGLSLHNTKIKGLHRWPGSLQQSLAVPQEYCHNWARTVNLSKTRVLLFQKKSRCQQNKSVYLWRTKPSHIAWEYTTEYIHSVSCGIDPCFCAFCCGYADVSGGSHMKVDDVAFMDSHCAWDYSLAAYVVCPPLLHGFALVLCCGVCRGSCRSLLTSHVASSSIADLHSGCIIYQTPRLRSFLPLLVRQANLFSGLDPASELSSSIQL